MAEIGCFEREGDEVSILSEFYGIIIKMYFQQVEHNPPHFHAIYNDYVAAIKIADGEVLGGELPPKALGLVDEWRRQHQAELLERWETQNFKKRIRPLE